MIDIVKISKKVLNSLSTIDYELKGENYSERLIFPNKKQARGNVKRISEQELRFLFIENFLKTNDDLFYSIETPTVEKYKFGKTYEKIIENIESPKISASIDMCVFRKNSNSYERLLNIEFKHKNTGIEKIAKDILKLMREEEDGAFIHLLENIQDGTLCNSTEYKKGVFDKFYKSFTDLKENWNNENKSIHMLILSLKQKVLIHRKITETDLVNLKKIFIFNNTRGDISELKKNGWEILGPMNKKTDNKVKY